MDIKYKVYNLNTGDYEDDSCIVTQDGKVAFWDESMGWSEAENQEDYVVQVISD